MSRKGERRTLARLVVILAAGVIASGTPGGEATAQQTTDSAHGGSAPTVGRRRCRTCAPAPAPAAGRGGAPSRRAVSDHTPNTPAAITLGDAQYRAVVDAECAREERAPVGGPRMYFRIMYPWFGRRVGPDEAPWRFDLEILRGPVPGVYRHFVFSFQDGTRSGTIQVLPDATRYGSGTVRVTPAGAGARFEVQGRSDDGARIQAVIECRAFETSEAVAG